MNAATNDEMLHALQRAAFSYFTHETNPANGLIADRTEPGGPASIAATGLGLSSYPVAAERGFLTRAEAGERTLVTLRFFAASEQSQAADATGWRGFYYHFLDINSGRRVWRCELSTIDTALLIAGMLTAAQYFGADNAAEVEIRELATMLYERVKWAWMLNGGSTISMGWKPRTGFLNWRWQGYNEALILYLLALGSPSHPIEPGSYDAWTSTYRWKKVYGHEFLYAGPLFIHQLSHLWIDFRGIRDAFMRDKQSDYFENSRRATYVQQQYAVRNSRGLRGYGEHTWGVTASDGPGPAERKVDGVKRRFFDYRARGVPYGPDDGTLAPWAVAASLPFAPEIVLPTLQALTRHPLHLTSHYGFRATVNETFISRDGKGWVSPSHLGLNQGPIVIMIENYLSGLPWRWMRGCRPLVLGLRRAGFTGGWLGG